MENFWKFLNAMDISLHIAIVERSICNRENLRKSKNKIVPYYM